MKKRHSANREEYIIAAPHRELREAEKELGSMMEPSLLALHRIPSDGGAANFSRYREGWIITR
ncbi:hypothetical protein C7Y46_08480 [Bacillus safensis]|nr:hypothetical protein C7Y46_08480 [Bacillus sp. SDF0016]